jgi:hypothetical protein
MDLRPYGMLLDKTRQSYIYHYDSDIVQRMLKAFVEWEDRLAACSMDICYTRDGRTCIETAKVRCRGMISGDIADQV